MYELGPASVDEHAALGRLAVRLGIDKVVVVGPDAAAIHTGAAGEGPREEPVLVDDVTAAVSAVAAETHDDPEHTVVLVKASRAAGLERVAAALLGPGENAA
jgi:UDP-N-acetylmuramoyl-tripeptide--D-alanyl-D-alanine ligase